MAPPEGAKRRPFGRRAAIGQPFDLQLPELHFMRATVPYSRAVQAVGALPSLTCNGMSVLDAVCCMQGHMSGAQWSWECSSAAGQNDQLPFWLNATLERGTTQGMATKTG